ncbi:Predicted acetyltransferase [Amycolatopsis marina]|uniref:Predicted acetyltransferase n=1 Tax=Amycolatopsis marina TaxID=490629 RepID=A0A1I1CKA7_9PSEU|nr:GNAT family N-acetyltransferase [Amycolatopsis marina]SFB63125.1 Predicted acetyltransferase [Amycolatopsis marina]
MLDLITPTTRLHNAWLDAHAEWGPGLHEDGFGLAPTDEVDSPTGFAAWIARLADESEQATCRWIVEDDQVLGGIALRHEFNDYVRWAGHIGFGIRPSARRRGLASWALGRMLDEAQVRGMNRVLVVCAANNVASAKTIERVGGVFEEVRNTKTRSRLSLLDHDCRAEGLTSR